MHQLDGLLTFAGRTSNLERVKRLLALVALGLAGCGGSSPSNPCAIDRGELPSWATAGFSDPHPSMPHVLGDDGKITAILFGDPLVAPPDAKRANKILWVSREPPTTPAPLKIHAVDGSRKVDRVVEDGPGPSIVDLPAGCWRLELSWGAQHDSMDLRYRAT
jgi:hypothetical protein